MDGPRQLGRRLAPGLLAVALIVSLAGVTACSSPPPSGGGLSDVPLLDPGPIGIGDDGAVTIDTSDGPVQIGAGALPAGWPLPDPEFPGASIDAAFGTGRGFTVSYSAPTDITDAVAAYVGTLGSSGYTTRTSTDLGGGVRQWELADATWRVNITAGYVEGATAILIVVAPA